MCNQFFLINRQAESFWHYALIVDPPPPKAISSELNEVRFELNFITDLTLCYILIHEWVLFFIHELSRMNMIGIFFNYELKDG